MCTARGVFRGRAAAKSPLRRPVDRTDARSVTVLVVTLLLVGPLLTWLACSSAWSHEQESVRARQAALFRVAATVRELYPPSGDTYLRTTWAEATWRAPDGTPRSGLVTVPTPGRVGAVEPMWVDARGQIVPEPPGHDDVVGAAVLAGLVTVLVLGTSATVVHVRLGRVFDRRRSALWDEEWASVEPQWSHRAR